MKTLIKKQKLQKILNTMDINSKRAMSWKDKANNNLLHLAVLEGNNTVIKQLFRLNHLLHEENKQGYTPIYLAKYLNNKYILERLPEDTNAFIKVQKNQKTYLFTRKEFFNYMEVDYLSNLEFKDPKIFKWLQNKCIWANKNGYISPNQKWLGAYFEKEIFTGKTADVTIKWLNDTKEFGLVANQDFSEKAFVGEYVGQVHKFRKRADNRNVYCFEYVIGYEYKTKYTVDAREKGNIIRYINHSFKPNLTPVSVLSGGIMHIIFRTNKAIKKGTELTYDYGPNYWQQREDPIE